MYRPFPSPSIVFSGNPHLVAEPCENRYGLRFDSAQTAAGHRGRKSEPPIHSGNAHRPVTIRRLDSFLRASHGLRNAPDVALSDNSAYHGSLGTLAFWRMPVSALAMVVGSVSAVKCAHRVVSLRRSPDFRLDCTHTPAREGESRGTGCDSACLHVSLRCQPDHPRHLVASLPSFGDEELGNR